MLYSDLIKQEGEYQYSANIQFDITDDRKLLRYIPNETSIELLKEFFIDTIKPVSTNHSRILYGSYGTGKSHFLTVLSIQNLNTYSEKLDKLHWAWPYDMSTKEMSYILLEYDTEKEFDIAISNWFTQEKIEEMFYETCYMIKYPHKTIFNQAYRAFLNQDYAIANNALLSVVDNLLAIYNKEKRSTKRYGILKPVVQYYETMPKIETYS